MVVDLAVRVVDQNVRSRIAVRITPNGEPLVCERPVESVVLSRRLAREILFVRTRGAPKATYNKIRVVEGFKLEKILSLHVADVFINGQGRRCRRREHSHGSSRSDEALGGAHERLYTSQSRLHSFR